MVNMMRQNDRASNRSDSISSGLSRGPLRAAIYARYSTDMQSPASIEDQIAKCRQEAERRGWKVVAVHSDRAISGSVRERPGYQQLLREARDGQFDIVLAEALDRLSRDLEDTAALYKQVTFSRINLVTITEGDISELHIGFKGTMNAQYARDLAVKTHRGLEGRVREGRSAGGRGYGYVVVSKLGPNGEPERGLRAINDAEAAIVRRIFSEFANGASPRAIAIKLNQEAIPGPDGGPWSPSTIYGNWRRGTGVLNNELYIGRLVWNRLHYQKDPTTRKRVSRPNPLEEHKVHDVPELRIIDDALWNRVKERQKSLRQTVAGDAAELRPERARRPAYLLSNLIKCGACSGGYSMVNARDYGCSNARNRGTCSNRLRIRRDELEESVLSGLKTHLMAPELVKEFIAEHNRDHNRTNAEREREHERRKEEAQKVERQIRAIIEAIKDGIRTPTMKDEILALEARKADLAAAIAAAPKPAPRLHPNLAEIYRQRVHNLVQELNREQIRVEATAALRALIQEIRLIPENGRLEIEIVGDLAAILALAERKKRSAGKAGGPEITLVAGGGFEPTTFRL